MLQEKILTMREIFSLQNKKYSSQKTVAIHGIIIFQTRINLHSLYSQSLSFKSCFCSNEKISGFFLNCKFADTLVETNFIGNGQLNETHYLQNQFKFLISSKDPV